MPPQEFQEVPFDISDWPQPRPGVWLLSLRGGRVYRIGKEPRGFLLLALNGREFWIGPGGLIYRRGSPPYFASAQEAVDAAVSHAAERSEGGA